MSKSLLNLNELLCAVNGTIINESLINKDCEVCFSTVQTDSRLVEKNTMFVPLIGEVQNGHKYIPQALEKGASVVLVNNSDVKENISSYEKYAADYPNVVLVGVENTLHGLQSAAEAYVDKVCKNMIRVSITGSSGKTTTKEMMVSVCKKHFGENAVAYTKGNFNSETGLPLSVFQIRGDEKIGIFEMGMNRTGEIGEISKVWKSQYGIITNVGTAHIGILGSRENIAAEKRRSLDYITKNGAAFVCAHDSFADYCVEKVKQAGGKVVRFGAEVPALQSGVEFIEDKGLFGTVFAVDGLKVQLSLSGQYNFQNALSVIACARELGITAAEIKAGLENVVAVSGRMETKLVTLKNGNKAILIKDCYNANLDSMQKVIDFCNGLKKIGKKIFVLADMKELGEQSKESHLSVGRKINEVLPDYVFLIGEEMKYAYEILEKKECAFWYEKSDQETFGTIAREINSFAGDNDVILLKGSHSMELEKLIPSLVEVEK